MAVERSGWWSKVFDGSGVVAIVILLLLLPLLLMFGGCWWLWWLMVVGGDHCLEHHCQSLLVWFDDVAIIRVAADTTNPQLLLEKILAAVVFTINSCCW